MNAPSAPLSGSWLVVAPASLSEDELVRALPPALADRGASIVPVAVDGGQGRDELGAMLRQALGEGGKARGVLSLLAFDEAPLPAHAELPRGVAQTLALVQALGDAAIDAPLWLITRGAVAVGPSDLVSHPLQALIWGFGRVVGLEYPERWGGLIDVGCALDARAIERFVAALGSPQDEDQMALRSAGLFVRRLVTAPLGDAVASRTFEPRGTVLVTGATGSLGVHIARWLARGGATHLVLTSRRGAAAPGAAELEAELTALGARVTFAACDVADRQALAALIERVEAEGAPIRSVFHVAGVVSLVKPLSATTIAEFASVVAGKDAGAQHLHHLFSDKPLHAFVLFSSITGVWGSGYQCAYSAANAYLDALAEHRRGLGLVATSMQWGPWAGKAHEEHQHQLERRGFHLMETEPALVGLEQALAHDETTISVVDIDWGLFAPAYAMARARPLLRDLPAVQRALKAPEEVSAARTTSDRKRTGELRQRLLSVEPGRRRRDMLVQHCQLEVGRVLKLDPRRVDITAPLASMGFDSVMSLELKKRLEAVLDVDLPSTLAWRFPTVEALVPFLAERVGISLEAPAEVVVQPPAAAEQVEAADLEDLSEAEVEALLLKKLEKLGGV